MKRTLLLSALLALSAACELAPPKDLVGYINLHRVYNQPSEQLQVTKSGLVSPNIQLSREEGVLRGTTYGEQIELRVEGNLIKGSRGTMPIELHVSREGNAVVARGMYGGRLADLAMCISSSDNAAPEGEVNSISGARACLLENTATVVKMLRELGDADAMAMLVTAYYH